MRKREVNLNGVFLGGGGCVMEDGHVSQMTNYFHFHISQRDKQVKEIVFLMFVLVFVWIQRDIGDVETSGAVTLITMFISLTLLHAACLSLDLLLDDFKAQKKHIKSVFKSECCLPAIF